MTKSENKTAGRRQKLWNFYFKYHKVLSIAAIFKSSLNSYPENVVKSRNRRRCVAISLSDFAWQPLRLKNKTDDRRLLERICDAYILSKKDQPKSGPYAVSGMWEGILGGYYSTMISAALSRDTVKLGRTLENIFRKNSLGLSMSGDMPSRRNPMSSKEYLNNYADTLLRLATFANIADVAKDMDNDLYICEKKIPAGNLWKKICAKLNIDPCYPVVGNTFGLLYPSSTKSCCTIPRAAFRHLHTAIETLRLVENKRGASILEIGGGFGGVLYYISQLLGKNAGFNLTSIDVPEINIISSYFLSKSLPGLKVYFYGENPHQTSKGKRSCVNVLPNCSIKDIAPNSISAVVNEDSFPEMPSVAVREYLKRIGEISEYFYSVNQDCGRAGQNRLSQIDEEKFGLECISFTPSWMRHGYFERVYRSIKNAPIQVSRYQK